MTWLDDLRRALALADGDRGRVVLVVGDDVAAVPALMEVVDARNGAPSTIEFDARALASAPPGATVALALRRADVRWLNRHRPIIAEHRLTVLLWARPDAADRLAREAPDLFDWIATRVDAPGGEPRTGGDALLDAWDAYDAVEAALEGGPVTLPALLALDRAAGAVDVVLEGFSDHIGVRYGERYRRHLRDALARAPELAEPLVDALVAALRASVGPDDPDDPARAARRAQWVAWYRGNLRVDLGLDPPSSRPLPPGLAGGSDEASSRRDPAPDGSPDGSLDGSLDGSPEGDDAPADGEPEGLVKSLEARPFARQPGGLLRLLTRLVRR